MGRTGLFATEKASYFTKTTRLLPSSASEQDGFAAFRTHYAEALEKGAPVALARMLAARSDVDLGSMKLRQENLYSWETMVGAAAYELVQEPSVPEAFVFEPPGRVGTRRTLPAC